MQQRVEAEQAATRAQKALKEEEAAEEAAEIIKEEAADAIKKEAVEAVAAVAVTEVAAPVAGVPWE